MEVTKQKLSRFKAAEGLMHLKTFVIDPQQIGSRKF